MGLSSIVLAGGRSSRFGRNKLLETIGGKSIIERVINRLATLSREVIIVTAHGEEIPCPSDSKMKTIADVYPGKGPLVGIYSGLIACSNSRAIVVGADMPFLDVKLLRYMSQLSHAFDVVVPRVKDKLEPLCAIYSKNCLGSIEELLKQNELRINKLFDMVKVRYVEEEEIDKFDPEHLSFFNINTRADLERARQIALQRRWTA